MSHCAQPPSRAIITGVSRRQVAEWLDIFLVADYMQHYIIIGGGKTCMLMLSPFVEIVLSVPWLLVWEERNGHHFTQYL